MPLILSALSTAWSLAAAICAFLKLVYHLNTMSGMNRGAVLVVLPLFSWLEYVRVGEDAREASDLESAPTAGDVGSSSSSTELGDDDRRGRI
jgi:hypothetical protein